MCENFRKDFFNNVMKKVGDETLLDTLNKNYQFTYHVCRNSKSMFHPNCKKYYISLKLSEFGGSCESCNMYFCETCSITSFHNRPNSYKVEKNCFECLTKKEYFKPQILSCPVCSNNDPTTFVYEMIHDNFFCFICRTKCSKNMLKTYGKINEISATGNSQDTSTPIMSKYNIVINVPLHSGVVLPEPKKHEKITIVNKGNNDLKIFPSIGCSIAGICDNVPTVLSHLQTIILIGATNNSWEVYSF